MGEVDSEEEEDLEDVEVLVGVAEEVLVADE